MADGIDFWPHQAIQRALLDSRNSREHIRALLAQADRIRKARDEARAERDEMMVALFEIFHAEDRMRIANDGDVPFTSAQQAVFDAIFRARSAVAKAESSDA